MTFSVVGLLRCRPEDIAESGRGLRMDAVRIDELVHARLDATWSGEGEACAAGGLDALRAALQHLCDAVSRCAEVLATAATGLCPARDALQRAAAHAAAAGLQLQCNGRVDASEFDSADAAAVEALARAALRTADEVDADAADALRRATWPRGRPVSGVPAAQQPAPALVRPARIPSPASPLDVAAWWAVLRPEARVAALRSHPDRIGALDGLPGEVRHAANVTVLERELAAAAATLARVGTRAGPRPSLDEVISAMRTHDLLTAVRHELSADSARRLVTLDLSDGGLAAVAVGDIDTAAHVAVIVPGLACDVTGDLDNVVSDAATMHETARGLAPQATLAAVAWIGYRTPDLLTAAFQTRAQAGARRLTSFTKGVDGAREIARVGGPTAGVHLTLVGHSYGSLAIGLALRHKLPVDDAVFAGSPGVGAMFAEQLGLGAEHVYVAEADDDVVADFGRFGQDPSSRSFGATPLPTRGRSEAERWLTESRGHSEYFRRGTESVHEITAVAVGARP